MKYKVYIDLTNDNFEENLPILSSPSFNTKEEAMSWYRKLDFDCEDLIRHKYGIDVILAELNDNKEIENTWII